MLEQELKQIWKNSSQAEKIKFDISRLMMDLNGKLLSFEKKIRNRDLREIGAAILGILIFSYMAWVIPFVLTKLACVLTIFWLVYVIYRLRQVKKYKKDIEVSSSYIDQLKHQKEYFLKEAKLLDSVLYWYVLPPFLINVLFVSGLGSPVELGEGGRMFDFLPFDLGEKLRFLGLVAAFSVFVVWLNKKAVKKNFLPLISRIEDLEAELENE